MDDPGTLELLGRLAVAGFVIIAPSLLFLGLVRGLERLRDDAFLDRLIQEQGGEIEDDVLTVLGNGMRLETGGDSSGHCPACGASNAPTAQYCRNCLGKLPS